MPDNLLLRSELCFVVLIILERQAIDMFDRSNHILTDLATFYADASSQAAFTNMTAEMTILRTVNSVRHSVFY